MSVTLRIPRPIHEESETPMRRLLVLTSLILLAAGCSTDKSGTEPTAAPAPATGGSVPASAPAAGAPAAESAGAAQIGGAKGGDAALKGNTAAICNQAAKTSGDFAATFAQNLKLQID